jgi:hypothetical protein
MNYRMIFNLLFIILFFCTQGKAQDYKNIEKIISEIETSLTKTDNKEQHERAAALSGDVDLEVLNKRITHLETIINELNNPSEDAVLESKLNELIAELKKIIEKQTTPPLSSSALQENNPDYSKHWQRQIYVRRLRVLLGGEIAKNTTFFFETDAPNLGKVSTNGTKDSKISIYVQDAQVQHTFMPELSIIAGLQLVGIARNGLQSAASLLALDYGSYQFTTSGPLDNSVGRDLGINLRGFLFNDRLEYRTGVFSGRNINLYSPLRLTGRFQYNFKDIEKGFYYTGTTLGKGNIFSVGCGIDKQGSYSAFAIDAMYDSPLGNLGSVTFSSSVSFLDGGGTDNDSTVFTGLIPKQSIYFAELGYFFKDWNIQPYVKYEAQDVNASVLKQVGANESNLELKNKLRSSQRVGFGVNYFISGHNINLKLLYEVVLRNRVSMDPNSVEQASNGTLTFQLQYFTF